MCKFVGKIKQIIPFKGEIKKIDSFVGEFIKNYKPPVYDNELPIEWNTVEIAKSSNAVYAYNKRWVKISSFVPTVDELLNMQLTLSFMGDYGEVVIESVSDASNTNEEGYQRVYFKSTELNYWNYFMIIPKGEKVPHGLYWDSDDYWFNNVYASGRNYKLYVPAEEPEEPDIPVEPDIPDTPTGIYDDEWPIEWNSLAVHNGENLKVTIEELPLVKISNLVPAQEQMESAEVTEIIGSETTTHAFYTSMDMSAFFSTDCKLYGYDDDGNFGVYVFANDEKTERGVYVLDLGSDEFGNLNTDFTLSLAQSATQYLYGHEAEATVSYNGVVLPDIESVWTDELKQQYPYAAINAQFLSQSEIEEMVQMGYAVEDGAGIFALQVYDTAPVYDGTALEPSETTETCANMITNSQGLHDLYDSMGYGDIYPTEWLKLVENTDAYDRSMDNPIWSNFDILNTDGSVYLAASEPVHSYSDPDVIIDGVGYKGAVLPALPEWDKTVYPYAYIWFGSTLKRLYVLPEASHMTMTDSGGNACIGVETGTTYMTANTHVGSTTWSSFTHYTAEESKTLSSSIGWANYDVQNADGTIYLSASEPIPVYEGVN